MGEMLWSAVCRGALLDRRWWPSWMRAVQTAADFRPGQVSVDMEPDDDTPNQPRRWFADPVTRLLIAHWHRDRMRLTCPATPEECLRAYLPQRAAAVKDLSQAALNRARATWRLRLPGVLFAYASGEVPSVSLPKATWRRLTRGVPMPDDPRASRPPGRHPVVRNDMDRERTILAASARSSNLTGRARDRARKVAAIAALKNLPPARSRLHTGLRRWCIFALESENGRSSIGYVPSTVFGYLKRLLAVFDGWPDRDPTEAASYELVELFVSRLEQAGDEDTTVTMKAMGSFARFYNLGREDEDELELDLDSYRTEHPVSANLISPRSYQRALASLTDGDGPEAAIVLMLAYRTGARLPEIMGLQVGDFIYGDRRLELVIQENEGRALKTKTSRRILPLDVLLDDDERAQLEAWLDQRRPVARAIGDSYVFGPIGAAAPPPDGMMRHRIEAALRKACGSDQISIPHLRHSFASCLLATLLLPQDVADPLVPDGLAAVVSRQRFVRVVDRFLGQGRLGGGAVHAVSQAMGHTGPATTLRSYCHLLDLCLGLYVSRPSSFVPVPAGWLRGRFAISPDAIRKADARASERVREHEDKPSDQSSAEKMLLGATPGVIRALAEVSLVEAAATRAARSVSRAQAAKIDDVALGQPYRLVEEIKRTPRVRDRSRQPKAYVVPWSIMVAGLDAPVDRPAAGVDQRIVERWRVDAAHLGAAAILGLDPHEGDTFATAVPQGRDAELLVDGRLKLPRRLRRPEQTALLAVTAWLRRDASHIRLKHLPDARAFVGILAAMGFSEDEVRLSVTNYAGERLSSGELHVFLRGSVPGHPLATRRGWTGSLVVRLQPTEIAGPRRGWQAARFALVMLAVDAGVHR